MAMIKNSLYIALTVAVSFAFLIFAVVNQDIYAETDADEEMKSDEEMAAVEMGGKVSGRVIRVDPASDILLIRDARDTGRVITVMTNDDTTYFGTDSLKTINPGDRISVDCISSGDEYVADNIVMEKRGGEKEPMPVLEKVLSD